MDNSLTNIVISARDQTQSAFASVGSRLDTLKATSSALTSSIAGLAGALSVGVITTWAEGVISAASALDDLADATGSTVESLSKLSNIAKVSGADFGTIDQAIKKLAVGMAGVDDESGKAGKALAALGISARDPAQAMLDLAKQFDTFRDGPEKAALAVAIFGKTGASLLPVLKDIAQNLDIAGTVTTKQAADAEALEKSWRLLGVQASSFKNALLTNIVPALTETISAFNAARAAGLGFFEAIQMTGRYTDAGIVSAVSTARDNVEALRVTFNRYTADGAQGLAQQLIPQLDAAEKRLSALIAIRDKMASSKMLSGEGTFDARDYRAGNAKPIAPTITDVANTKKQADNAREIAAALREWKEQEDALADALSRHNKIQAELAEHISKMQADFVGYVEKQHEAVRQYDEQTRAIGATEQELQALELARQAEIRDMRLLAGWGDDAIRIYDEWAAAIGRRNAKLADESGRAAEKKFAEEWARTAERIGDQLTDSFLRAAESGRGFFKSLASDLKRMFSQLVLRPIVQGVVAPLAGGITSALYGGGASAQGLSGGGIGNYVSAGKSIYGLGDTSASWGSAASGFAMSGTGEALGLSTTVFDSAAGSAAALTVGGEALAALAAAAPYIAAVVAIGYALYQAFGQEKGGPKLGGYAASGSITPWNRTDQFSGGGFQAGHFTPDAMDAALQPVVDSWVKGTSATIKALGGSAVGIGFDLGIDKDPNGQAANRLGIRATVGGKQVYNYWSGDSALGRDDAALQSAIELESKRALVSALAASDLPASIAAVFDTAIPATMSAGAIDNLMAFGAAMKGVIDAISGDVLTDATNAWNDAQLTSVDRLRTMGNEVIRLSGAMDGSTESMQALASASQTYRQAVTQVLVAIRSVAQQAEQMQGSLVQSLQTWGMSDGQSFDYFVKRANQQALGLGSATSPEQVNAIAGNTYDAISSAFGALPDDLKDVYRPALLGFLSEFGDGVNQALANIQNATLNETSNPFAAASDALDGAAQKFDGAAITTANAASTMNAAASKIDAAVDRFVSALPIQVEATVVSHLV